MRRMESRQDLNLIVGLLAFTLLAGCATMNGKRASKSQGVSEPRPHEARRLPLEQAQSPPMTAKPNRLPKVRPVQYFETLPVEAPLPNPVADDPLPGAPLSDVPLPEAPLPGARLPGAHEELLPSLPAQAVPTQAVPTQETESYPIDLPTALRLAGANNLQIAFAAEQVEQAIARIDAADALWIPSLIGGLVYNSHAGRLQATEGDVSEISRNSLYVGAGAGTGNAPLNGGSGGPARMFVDLPLVDVLFDPLAARQAARGAEANEVATFNDTLLSTALTYLDLVRAGAMTAVSEEAVSNAEQLARITDDFARSGRGLQADSDRANAELASRRQDVLKAREDAAVTSAQLARLLRLDPATRLFPAEQQPVRLQLVEPTAGVYDLIGQAHSLRPELARSSASVREAWYRTQQEHWRPFIPNLYAGFSGGGFGGAQGSSVDNFSDRTDFDVGTIWKVENLGLGNRARRMERNSLHRQAHVTLNAQRDQVAMEVTQAYEQVRYRGEQIEAAEPQVRSATNALRLNLEGIRGGVLRPIEIQQAIGALASARQQYLDAVVDHNQAQFALLRAIGQPATQLNCLPAVAVIASEQ